MDQPVTTPHDRRFLIGAGSYLADMRLPGELAMQVVRSPHAHARVVEIETAAATALAGVVGVLTGADLAADGIGPLPCQVPMPSIGDRQTFVPPYPVLAQERTRHVGQAVAVVVAENTTLARDAAERIEVAYRALPAVTDTAAALEAAAPKVWEERQDNICMHWQIGDAPATTAAFAEADAVARLRLVNNRLVVNAMEPRGAIGQFDRAAESYTLFTTCQSPHNLRQVMAGDVLGLPTGAVRVVVGDVGGGFGMKAFAYPEQALVLWAAKRFGRPVAWRGERAEGFVSDTQARDHVTDIALALDRDGRFRALRVETIANLGAYLSLVGPFIPTTCYTQALPGVYAIPAVHVDVKGVFSHTVPVDAYRGAGRAEATYALERVIELAARQFGLDGVDLRRRNLVPVEAMPHRTPLDCVYDSGDFGANMAGAMAKADWPGFADRRQVAAARGLYRGIGIANYVEPAGYASGEATRIRFDPSGGVTVLVGSVSCGQGHEESYARMVAERLGVAAERIRIVQGDTERVPELGSGNSGSHFLQTAGPALHGAADRIVDKGTQIAAHLLEAGAHDIEFAGGAFVVAGTDRRVSLDEVVAAAFDPGALTDEIQPGLDESYYYKAAADSFPSGCHVAEVEVDPETGQVAVVRYTVVDDFGRVLNPALVEAQVHGGIAQGLGQALIERCVYDRESGQLLTGSLLDYGLPRADDLPSIDVGRNETPCRTNPLGVKGCGEAGATAAPAALINAILDALAPIGVTELDMPATPERVWRAIRAAGAG